MAVNNEIMLKIENVSKIYRLGEIGGTTLKEELQRLGAKIRRKPDPTKKVGAKNYNKGEKFKALDNVSFEVKKGERIGIIGHNGAGKSTLLKLISRVTGPSSGAIYMNGRVASMLEVGTGFHPELTGRENVYMNGAILGMTKKEIDAKMEDIIEFSEVRQFIDTPVKRYSSGMYVKLGFSVAAHLDSEIMIMDEVLAVGDVAFQNKCLEKMRSVSEENNRTILYVSHNMNTIRKLCDKVIVLSKGKLVYFGEVDKGIEMYLSNVRSCFQGHIETEHIKRMNTFDQKIILKRIDILNGNNGRFIRGEKIKIKIQWSAISSIDKPRLRLVIINRENLPVASALSKPFFEFAEVGQYTNIIELDTSLLVEDLYYLNFDFYQVNQNNQSVIVDCLMKIINFEVDENVSNENYLHKWSKNYWGNIQYPDIKIY